ncbi:MAG: site-specific integrase [Methylocella sp.]
MGWPYGHVAQILILTGQRRSEVTDLAWSELDLDARTWTLPAVRAKNKREHTIPLSDPAIAILKTAPRIAGSEFVFTFSGDNPLVGYALIKRRLDDLLPKDMIPWRLHDLRRTFASNLARMGIAVHVTEKLLNHTGGTFGGITGVYQRFNYADEQRSAVEAWAHFVEELTRSRLSGNILELSTVRG